MELAQEKRILLAGGGSGGHLYPLLAVAEAIKKIAQAEGQNISLYYFGPTDERATILSQAGVRMRFIASGKFRRYFSLQNILDIPKFFLSVIQVFWKTFWLMPDAIFSKGGPGALPVIFAGWFYRVPILIHESDAAPGITTLISSPFAKRIALSFEITSKYFNAAKVFLSGNPVRADLLESRPEQRASKEEFGFKPDEPLTLILGGSLGSQRINEFVVVNLPEILAITQVLHQTGKENFEDVKKLSQAELLEMPVRGELESRYEPIPYFESNFKTAYAAADLVVSRAGSGTIFEIAALGKPSIIIPLFESANDHQRLNAFEFAKTGAAVVIEENNLLPGIFANQLKAILGNQESINKMSAAAYQFFKPKAAELIAQEILKI